MDLSVKMLVKMALLTAVLTSRLLWEAHDAEKSTIDETFQTKEKQ